MNIFKSSIIITILILLSTIFNIVVESNDLFYAITVNTDNNAQELVIIDMVEGTVTHNSTFYIKDPIQTIISVNQDTNTITFLAGNQEGTLEYLIEYSMEYENATILNTIDFIAPNYVVVSQQVIWVNQTAYLNPFCASSDGSNGDVSLFAWNFIDMTFKNTQLNLPDLNTKMGFWTIDPFLAYDNNTDSFYTGYFSDIKGDANRLLIAKYPRLEPTTDSSVYFNITGVNIQNLMKLFTDNQGNVIAAIQSLDLTGTTKFCQIDFSTQTCETKLILNMGPLFNNQPYVLNQDKTKLTLVINTYTKKDKTRDISIVTYDLATWKPISNVIELRNSPWMRVYANLYTYFYYL